MAPRKCDGEPVPASAATVVDGEPASAGAAKAVDCTVDWSAAPSRPVVMECVLAVRRLDVVQTHTEACMFRGFLEVYWTDPRLAGREIEAEGVPADIWRPRIAACPGLKMPEAEAYKQLPTYFKKDPVSDGRVKMVIPMAFGDDGWDLNDDLSRLRAFPFDGARIDLSVIFGGARRDVDADVVLSLQRANTPGRAPLCGPVQQFEFNCSRRSGEYAVRAVSLGVSHHEPPAFYRHPSHADGAKRVALVFSIHLERSPYFYVWKGIVPLYSTAVFAFVTFALEPEGLSGRVGMISTLFLTTYAIQHVSIDRLPRLPFGTAFDSVVQSVLFSLVGMVVGQCAAYRVARPHPSSDEPFDTLQAERVDYITLGLMSFYLLAYSIGFCCLYRVYLIRKLSGAMRPWCSGPDIRNRWPVIEGYRLWFDDTFAQKHGKSFLGQGVAMAHPEVNF